MKAILIRVGADTKSTGSLGPIFDNDTFEFVPIPEDKTSKENRRYNNTKGGCGKYYSYFVDEQIRNEKMHFDPEFKTFTYGDHTKKVGSKFLEGDYLVFYAGLKPYESNKQRKGLFIIGYFKIDRIFKYKDLKNEKFVKILKNNAHIKCKKGERDTIIIKGHPNESKLLEKAIRISDYDKNYCYASKTFSKLIDKPIRYNMMRSKPRTVLGKHAEKLIKFIKIKKL